MALSWQVLQLVQGLCVCPASAAVLALVLLIVTFANLSYFGWWGIREPVVGLPSTVKQQ